MKPHEAKENKSKKGGGKQRAIKNQIKKEEKLIEC
jgi:hypothetical protein